MTQVGRTALGLALAAAVLAIDQGSKQLMLTTLDLPLRGDIPVIPRLLDFAMAWNDGVTFGLLKSGGGIGPWLLGGRTRGDCRRRARQCGGPRALRPGGGFYPCALGRLGPVPVHFQRRG
jgi:hypothetical protein